jgi:hypothetical protein
MGDDIIPTPVTNVLEAPNEAIQHVVAHEGRITHLEEQLQAHITDVMKQIGDTKTELFTAIEHAHTEQASQLEGKLSRLEELATKLENQVIAVPTDVVEDTGETVQAVPAVPEVEQTVTKITPKGLRQRRKVRHGK